MYFSEGRDDLTIEVVGRLDESYTLMVAGWNYYNELESVEISDGEKDIFQSQNWELIIDFDDNKSWKYNIVMDDFVNTNVETVVFNNINSTGHRQKYNIDWIEEDNLVTYELDANDDGIFDIQSTLNKWSVVWNISWYLNWNTNAKMAWWKVYLDINNNGILEENEEPFDVTDNTGYYSFENLIPQDYTISIDSHKNWNIISPNNEWYSLYLNKGQNIQHLNFNVEKINGKSKK